MMTSPATVQDKRKGAAILLRRTGMAWFLVAAAGQAIFIAFIVLFYWVSTFGGDFAAWNDKGLITGHVPGDLLGNLMFATHVVLAAVITLGGLWQLVPALRRRFPTVHRWNGRVFMAVAYIMAIGGLWMTWGRGSHLSVISGVFVSLNGVLILLCATLALRHAIKRQIDSHRRWAMRTFLAVSGVWFFRVWLMGWIVVNQSPRGMNETLSGPADIGLMIASYVLPLIALEAYLRANDSSSRGVKRAMAGIMIALTLLMAIGIAGTTLFMWFPVI